MPNVSQIAPMFCVTPFGDPDNGDPADPGSGSAGGQSVVIRVLFPVLLSRPDYAGAKGRCPSDGGLALSSLLPWQQMLVSDFHSRLKHVSGDQLSTAVVKLELQGVPDIAVRRVILTVASGGVLVAQWRASVRLLKVFNVPKRPS